MKKYPKRKIYFSIPLILFIGFTMNYSDIQVLRKRSLKCYNSSSNSDYTNKLRKAAEDLYDKCQIYGKYDSRC